MKTLIAGTFDNFHVGHQWLIWQAVGELSMINGQFANLNELTIIIARDATVEHIKGCVPRNNEDQRLQRVEQEVKNLNNIQVRLGRADADFWRTVEEVAPDKILLGYDQRFNEAESAQRFPRIKVERCTAYQPEWFKSSRFGKTSQ